MSFRRGACPALSAPMQTGDGLLVRLATAGASLAPGQLIALCAAAERHGNGLVEITARGNFQIRGLTAESAPALAGDIAALELGLRDGVPVETNPLAGLDPTETANAAPVAAAIREALDATDLKARLAPKVSVVVDGGGTSDLSDIAADVRLTAVRRDAGSDARPYTPGSPEAAPAVAWLISTGGDAATATPLAIADSESTAVRITLATLQAVAAGGPATRARDLRPADLKALLSPPAASQSPEVSSFPDPAAAQPPSLGRGEEESRRLGRAPSPLGERSRGDSRAGEGGREIALSDGRIALAVALPFGSMRAHELDKFMDRNWECGVAELRLAPGRSLLLLCASGASAAGVRQAARAAGLVVDAGDPRARIFACPGSAGCASGHLPARDIAVAVARQLPAGEAFPTLHISGCPKGCAHPAPAAFTLAGTADGPVLVRNGSARGAGSPFAGDDIVTGLAALLGQAPEGRETTEPPARGANALAHAGD